MEIQTINDFIDEIISEIVNSESSVQNEFYSDKKKYNAAEMLNAHINGSATRQNEIITILLRRKNKVTQE